MQYKCKICAGTLTIDPKTKIATCDYCGTQQAVPLFNDDSSKILFERGNQYLSHNEYDKAEAIFSQLLSVNSSDGEIFWDIVLCQYGVTYAKDPSTGKYIPTCNRTLVESIFDNDNYKHAIELSSPEKKELYKHDAEIIENIQKGILELSRKEKPFDIFISYKETDNDGNRTKDSIAAQSIYEKLTDLGYKVFFSRITLETKIGEEYEPYIYAALSSSTLMIVIGSSRENIESAWVKNEWSRFITMRREDSSKNLIPIYFGMNMEDLPDEFSLLAAQNMNDDDFEQELIRGIKKLIPNPVERLRNAKRREKYFVRAAVIVLVIVAPFLLYLVISNIRLTARKAKYEEAMTLFKDKDYENASILLNELGDYENAEEILIKCSYYADYDEALELYYNHNYPEALWKLKTVGDYSDVMDTMEKCEKLWRESVATVVEEMDFTGGRSPSGTYYINENGAVESLLGDVGTDNKELTTDDAGNVIGKKDIEPNEHGKVISIGANYRGLYALYEDGFVCNSAVLNGLDDNWDNIIQISDLFGVTSVALKNDGTLTYGAMTKNINNSGNNGYDDSWLMAVDSWSGIKKIDWRIERIWGSGMLSTAILMGVDSDGKVQYACYEFTNFENSYFDEHIAFKNEMENYLNGLTNIVDISVSDSIIGAMDSEGIVHIFSFVDGTTTELANVKSIFSNDGIVYIVDEKNNLIKFSEDTKLLEGIVYLKKGFCISQNGSIYKYDGMPTEGKTKVMDAWIER